MFALKATALLALPVLASAGTSTLVASRAQRRSELLELLQHNHEKRAEQYNDEQPLCEVQAGNNGASFTAINNDNVGKPLASTVNSYVYANEDCATLQKCMSACIVDGDQCIGISYVADVCTLLGLGYDGPELEVVPTNFQQMTDAGTTSASSGGVGAMTVATCAIKGLNNDNVATPDSQAGAGRVGVCVCGPGRSRGSTNFVCQATGVPANYFDPADPPQILDGPITTTTPITWSAAYQAVPAVMNNNQCASICLQDAACQAYLLTPGAQLSSCYKIGLSGAYSSPPGFPFTPDTRRVKRQAAGQTGSFGNAGDIFGQPAGSQIDTNKNNHPGPSQKAGLRKRTMRHMGQSQW